ncbi:MAG TPA: hypothetical protein VFM55_08105 [Micromonosporaceae bacterium]|nr:hypothetical protein [Micromonosporaceae bacterium]
MTDTTDPPAEAQSKRFAGVVQELATLLGPLGVLTGILYYFGYASAKAYYTYFGISLSVLDLSTTDYLLRADTFFRPLTSAVLLALGLFGVHHLLRRFLGGSRPRRARVAASAFAATAVVLGAMALAGLYGRPSGLASPISLGLAALAVEYAIWAMDQHGAPTPALRATLRAVIGLRRGLVVAIVSIATFWAVTNIAHARGSTAAQLVELSLSLQPQAVVYSVRDLHLPGPGVGVTPLAGGDGDYRFRYNGLRPLRYANDRWFLVPVGWRHDNGATVIVLQDDPDKIRVDLAP